MPARGLDRLRRDREHNAKEIEELDKSGKLRGKDGKAISGKAMLAKAKKATKKGGLGRVEFTGAIVHMAIMKYIQQGTYTDVSDAVEDYARVHTQSHAPRVGIRKTRDGPESAKREKA